MPVERAPAGDALLQQASELIRDRRIAAADELLSTASRRVSARPAWSLLQGVVHTRLGRIDRAVEQLLPLLSGAESYASEATAALADAYHFSQRTGELRALLDRRASWAATPRGQLFSARLRMIRDPEQAVVDLLAIAAVSTSGGLQRLAGFDAVRLLDRLGRYREAFDLATRLHAADPPFDMADFMADVHEQQRLLTKRAAWCRPRAPETGDTAFIVGLPRSGTTLLEQMLDGHPAIAGIGEYEGLGQIAGGIVDAGMWPYRLNYLPLPDAARMQADYRRLARRRSTQAATGTTWTLDKSLLTWRWLPAVAAVLPGSVCLQIEREPRDMAISAFLSYLDPQSFGWTGRMDAIRQVIAAQRALVPLALDAFELPHERVVYEALVADPRAVLQRCLDRLGLRMDERVLSPEHNPRTAMTLSGDQVRRPVNDSSIGRWRHYEWAFEGDWDALSA